MACELCFQFAQSQGRNLQRVWERLGCPRLQPHCLLVASLRGAAGKKEEFVRLAYEKGLVDACAVLDVWILVRYSSTPQLYQCFSCYRRRLHWNTKCVHGILREKCRACYYCESCPVNKVAAGTLGVCNIDCLVRQGPQEPPSSLEKSDYLDWELYSSQATEYGRRLKVFCCAASQQLAQHIAAGLPRVPIVLAQLIADYAF